MKKIIHNFETERLILREWQLKDADDMVEGLSRLETAKNLTTPFPYTKENAYDFINKHLHNDEKNYYFAIVLKSTNKVIGGMSLEFRNDENVGNGGIWLNEKFCGMGFGSEVWNARSYIAFEELGAEELRNGYFDFNNRSAHMQEKAGFKIVGQKENFSHALNKKVTEVIASLTRDEYFKRKELQLTT